MSDLIVIQPQVTQVTVTEDVNNVVISSVGVTGATGATGAKGDKGDTGDQGQSGIIAVTAPITNSGTSTSATIGVDAGSTSTAGVLQLTDSTSSTSTTTAATPNAVKSAYDLAAISPILPTVSGIYYRTPYASLAGQGVGANERTHYTPIFVPVTTTYDRIAITTASTFVGTSTVRLGIYNNLDGEPSTVVLDAGTVSPTAASTNYQITISQSLSAGFYWLAFCQQGTAPTTGNYQGATSVGANLNSIINGQNSSPQGGAFMSYTQNSVTGAFATATSLTKSTNPIYVWLRAA
jgi:hypothetical protein